MMISIEIKRKIKRLVAYIIPSGLAKKPYAIVVQLLDDVAKLNLEMEQDFMLATVITQMDEIAKRMTNVEDQCKKKI